MGQKTRVFVKLMSKNSSRESWANCVSMLEEGSVRPEMGTVGSKKSC
jgi:hypothetical protein